MNVLPPLKKLRQLAPNLGTAAIRNHKHRPMKQANNYAPTMRNALNWSFAWDTSPEGDSFWDALYGRLREREL